MATTLQYSYTCTMYMEYGCEIDKYSLLLVIGFCGPYQSFSCTILQCSCNGSWNQLMLHAWWCHNAKPIVAKMPWWKSMYTMTWYPWDTVIREICSTRQKNARKPETVVILVYQRLIMHKKTWQKLFQIVLYSYKVSSDLPKVLQTFEMYIATETSSEIVKYSEISLCSWSATYSSKAQDGTLSELSTISKQAAGVYDLLTLLTHNQAHCTWM